MDSDHKKLLAEDLQLHRDFLESQLRQVKWGVTTLVLLAGAAVYFIVGKSTSDLQQYAKEQVNERIVN